MNPLPTFLAIISLATSGLALAGPADAERVEKTFQLSMEKWALEIRTAPTPDARAKVWTNRPDTTAASRQMWQVIGGSLEQDWTLDYAAWFLRMTPGLRDTKPDGSSTLTFARERAAILKAVETTHIKSPKLTQMCFALTTAPDPQTISLLEKVQATNPDAKVQGVAALAASISLKSLGDEGEIMRKRLTYLRKAIIQSSDVEINGTAVSKLAEDELYIIRYLTKGRVAPDLTGVDSAGRPLKLSDYQGKVVVLLFWNSNVQDADRVVEITNRLAEKLKGKPFTVIGVNNDPLEKLRSLQSDSTVTWPNFSDPENKLAAEYRVASLPLVYVLDGERKIHYTGAPGSFAELTADALLSESKPAEAIAPTE